MQLVVPLGRVAARLERGGQVRQTVPVAAQVVQRRRAVGARGRQLARSAGTERRQSVLAQRGRVLAAAEAGVPLLAVRRRRCRVLEPRRRLARAQVGPVGQAECVTMSQTWRPHII